MVPYGPGIPQINPAPRLRAIVKPGAPVWAGLVARPGTDARSQLLQVTGVLAVLAAIVGLVAGIAWIGSSAPVVASVLFAVFIGGGAALAAYLSRRYDHYAISAPHWTYKSVTLKGEALTLLEDIDSRFHYAERMVGEVPTGINWSDVSEEVRVLMWDSAGHAARVTTLDAEIHEMRYAARGTPQAAFRRELQERRAEHWQVMKDAQREAEDLANVAGNAAAAAKLALLRTGSLAALEVVAPSPRAVAAREALAEARARLQMLADVWGQLDEGNSALAERTEVDYEQSRPRAAETRRRRRR